MHEAGTHAEIRREPGKNFLEGTQESGDASQSEFPCLLFDSRKEWNEMSCLGDFGDSRHSKAV